MRLFVSFTYCRSNLLMKASIFRNSSEQMDGIPRSEFWRRIPRVDATYTFSLRSRPAAKTQLAEARTLSSSSTWRYSSENTWATPEEHSLDGLPLHTTEFRANQDFLGSNEGDNTLCRSGPFAFPMLLVSMHTNH